MRKRITYTPTHGQGDVERLVCALLTADRALSALETADEIYPLLRDTIAFFAPVEAFGVYVASKEERCPLPVFEDARGVLSTAVPLADIASLQEVIDTDSILVFTQDEEGGGTGSMVYVPVHARVSGSRPRVTGALWAWFSCPGVYPALVTDILQWLADRVGAVLANARVGGEYAGASELTALLRTLVEEIRALRRRLPCDSRPPAPARPNELLTRRERQILAALALGDSYVAIATQFRVSPATVKFHCRNLYRKLGVKNRLQAVLHSQPRS